MRDHATVWDNCLQMIRRNVNLQSFKTWFEPIKPVRLQDNALTIQVPNKFFYEWLEEHYVGLLKNSIRKELGDRGRLEYQILMGSPERPIHTTPEQSGAYMHGGVEALSIKNPFVIPGIKKMKVDPQLNPLNTFDSFIEGDCNRLARSAGLAVAKKPGGTAFNPLVIYGATGLGKTHLAHAIGNDIVKNTEGKSILYVSSENFTNQVINAIRNNAVGDVINFYQLIDVLIIDDIQFFANKFKMQEIFFNIFNQLHQTGRQIVMTSDRPPKDLEGIEDRLISRFKWGLTADLQAPDLETRNNHGVYWRVNFSDQANTSIYISESTGEILQRRNSFWRVRDFFWMLHIMDYSGRENFNNALVIGVALIALWLGISGFLLLFGSFPRHDFFFLTLPEKTGHAVISLHDPDGAAQRTVRLRKGSNLFLSLALLLSDLQMLSVR